MEKIYNSNSPETLLKNKKVIHVENLHKSFVMNNVIKGLDLDVLDGESFVLLGGSGSGKSVLLRCILGLLEPDHGKIEVAGYLVNEANRKTMSKIMANIGVMFQSSALFDSLTVWENISFRAINEGVKTSKAKEIASEKLKLVDLDDSCLNRYPSDLSGGMVKRVALARSIAHNPKILFCDEPTTGLDPITANLISELIRDVVRKVGATALTITHDLHCMEVIADRVGLLSNGQIYWQGKVDDLISTSDIQIREFLKFFH